MRLWVVDDARFEAHLAPGVHPECPERLRAARAGLNTALRGYEPKPLPPRLADQTELLTVHDARYLLRLDARLRDGTGYLDPDTFFSAGSREAAWLAAGSAAQLARELTCEGGIGFALLRPPGHHAECDRSMGFCLLNNVAIAAHAALGSGADRVAVLDWDVHHGNGTAHAFESDRRVLFISTHQWPFYPGTGAAEDVGSGDGAGYTCNIGLPAGASDGDYAHAFLTLVLPLLRSFRPNLLLISAGFDAHRADPLAQIELQTASFGALAGALRKAADVPVGMVLEGGYDLGALEESVESAARGLLAPFTTPDLSHEAPTPAARAQIERTRRALLPYWSCLG